jgi:hypothetical protein
MPAPMTPAQPSKPSTGRRSAAPSSPWAEWAEAVGQQQPANSRPDSAQPMASTTAPAMSNSDSSDALMDCYNG